LANLFRNSGPLLASNVNFIVTRNWSSSSFENVIVDFIVAVLFHWGGAWACGEVDRRARGRPADRGMLPL